MLIASDRRGTAAVIAGAHRGGRTLYMSGTGPQPTFGIATATSAVDPKADLRHEIEELLRALVGLADTFLGRPVTIPEWVRKDPHLHDQTLVELCRLYDEEGQLDLTPQLLPMLARRFPELVAHIEARSQGKSGAHRIERMMTLWIEGFGNSVDDAAKVVARAANVSPEVQYYRWRRSNSDKKAP